MMGEGEEEYGAREGVRGWMTRTATKWKRRNLRNEE